MGATKVFPSPVFISMTHPLAMLTAASTWMSYWRTPMARRLAAPGRYHGVLALGALLRGDTDHYELLAAEVTKGLASVAMHTDVPIAFGVVTCDTLEQALHRAGTKAGNKGADAMLGLIEMINLQPVIDNPPAEDTDKQ